MSPVVTLAGWWANALPRAIAVTTTAATVLTLAAVNWMMRRRRRAG